MLNVSSHIPMGPMKELSVLILLAGPCYWATVDVDECCAEEGWIERNSCSALVLRGIRLVARSSGLCGSVPLSRLLSSRSLWCSRRYCLRGDIALIGAVYLSGTIGLWRVLDVEGRVRLFEGHPWYRAAGYYHACWAWWLAEGPHGRKACSCDSGEAIHIGGVVCGKTKRQ